MRLLILDNFKITKTTLPNKIDGVYVLNYKMHNTNVKKDIIIEAKNDNWVISSNSDINIIQDNKVIDEVNLVNYSHYVINLKGYSTNLDLYTLPTVEKNTYTLEVPDGDISIGSSSDATIIYNSENILDIHAGIYKQASSYYIASPEDVKNPSIYLNDKLINGRAKINTGDIIFINGLKIIWMRTFIKINNPLNKVTYNKEFINEYKEDNFNNTVYDTNGNDFIIKHINEEDYFFHTPNIKLPIKEKVISIDEPPVIKEGPEYVKLIPSIVSLALISTSFISLISIITSINSNTNIISLIISILLTIVVALLGIFYPKIMKKFLNKKDINTSSNQLNEYTNYLKSKEEEINQAIINQSELIKSDNININECLEIINNGVKSLWKREIKDDDFLNIRTGIGSIPAKIKLDLPKIKYDKDENSIYKMIENLNNSKKVLENVPVPFNLVKNRVSTILSDTEYGEAFVNSIILQLITLQSPQDLKLVFLLNDTDSLDYAMMLPHVFNENKTLRYFAKSHDEMKNISSELESIFLSRQENTNSNNYEINEDSKNYKKYEPYYLIITNDIINVKNIPIVDLTLNSIENLGFSLLMIEKNMNSIPKRCDSFISLSQNSGNVMEKDIDNQIIFSPEFNTELDMYHVAEELLNIPLKPKNINNELPALVTFLDTYNISKIEQLNISNKWQNNDSSISVAVPIGVHQNKETFYLDQHDNGDGSNGLVVGSSASGKSEFLSNYILSLAVNFSPLDVNVVVFDYLNGPLKERFNKSKNNLPHITGFVSDLEDNTIYSFITALRSELKRRESLFNDAVNVTNENNINIYKYQKLYHEHILKKPLSQLFIVIDEFADLIALHQDFFDELLSLYPTFNKYGIHLLLATKEDKIIDDRIRSLINFTICFKTQSEDISNNLIGNNDAYYLKNPGNFVFRLGNEKISEYGASIYSNLKYQPASYNKNKIDDSITFINNVGSTIKSINNFTKSAVNINQSTELDSIVDYIINLSNKEDFDINKILLDPIPNNIYVANLSKKYNYQNDKHVLSPIIGEYYIPDEFRNCLLSLNITNNNTFIYSSSSNSNEDLLSTLLYNSMLNVSPNDENIYFIDSNLKDYKEFYPFPHVCDTCNINDYEKIRELILLLEQEISKRKELFIKYNNSFIEYNSKNNDTLPLKVCIINNIDLFVLRYPNILNEFIPLFKDGICYGVTFVIVSDSLETYNKVNGYFDNKICLQLDNNNEYMNILNIRDSRLVPRNVQGRGLIEIDKNVYEFQTALIYTRNEITNIIRKTCKTICDKYKDFKKIYIPYIPKVPYVDRLYDYVDGLSSIPIGYDIEVKDKYYYDFNKDKATIISSDVFDNQGYFLNALVSLLKRIPNLDIKIIDMDNIFDILTVSTTCYQNNFIDALNDIMKELDYLCNDTMYIITGIGSLNEKVNEDMKRKIDEYFLLASKNSRTHYIFIDDYKPLEYLKKSIWYPRLVNEKNGIWLGSNPLEQKVINIDNIIDDDQNINNKDLCLVSIDGKKHIIKKAILVESDSDNNGE